MKIKDTEVFISVKQRIVLLKIIGLKRTQNIEGYLFLEVPIFVLEITQYIAREVRVLLFMDAKTMPQDMSGKQTLKIHKNNHL